MWCIDEGAGGPEGVDKNARHVLVVCPETERWGEKFVNSDCLTEIRRYDITN
jgi:hypothetical protein